MFNSKHKVAFHMLVLKTKTRGAARTQRRTSNVANIWPSPPSVKFSLARWPHFVFFRSLYWQLVYPRLKTALFSILFSTFIFFPLPSPLLFPITSPVPHLPIPSHSLTPLHVWYFFCKILLSKIKVDEAVLWPNLKWNSPASTFYIKTFKFPYSKEEKRAARGGGFKCIT